MAVRAVGASVAPEIAPPTVSPAPAHPEASDRAHSTPAGTDGGGRAASHAVRRRRRSSSLRRGWSRWLGGGAAELHAQEVRSSRAAARRGAPARSSGAARDRRAKRSSRDRAAPHASPRASFSRRHRLTDRFPADLRGSSFPPAARLLRPASGSPGVKDEGDVGSRSCRGGGLASTVDRPGELVGRRGSFASGGRRLRLLPGRGSV